MIDLSAQDFTELLQSEKNIQILDVREEIEFHTFNIGGLNIPLGKLATAIADDELPFELEIQTIVICQHGVRSKTGKQILINAGFSDVRNLIGGLNKLQRIN